MGRRMVTEVRGAPVSVRQPRYLRPITWLPYGSWSHPSEVQRYALDQLRVVLRGVDVHRMTQVAASRHRRHQLGPGPDDRSAADVTLKRLKVAPELAP